jgi:DNA polymerase-3 subunit gamma/tau
MLLSNATVQSLAGGTLTIAFAKPGDAKGFTTSGSDKDLAAALSAMFGMSVGVATIIAGGSPPPRPQAEPSAGHGERQAESDSGRAAGSGGNQPRRESQPRDGSHSRDGSQSNGGSQARGRDRSADQGRGGGRPWQGAGSRLPAVEPGEPEPTDLPAPDVLTGTDLIERELGGRVIQEIDGP